VWTLENNRRGRKGVASDVVRGWHLGDGIHKLATFFGSGGKEEADGGFLENLRGQSLCFFSVQGKGKKIKVCQNAVGLGRKGIGTHLR